MSQTEALSVLPRSQRLPLNLLFISRMLPSPGSGGMEDHAAWLMSAMVRRGHMVHVVTTTRADAISTPLSGVDVISSPGDPYRWSRQFMAVAAKHAARLAPDVVVSESTGAVALAGVWPTVFHLHGNHINELRAPLSILSSPYAPRLRHTAHRLADVIIDYIRWRPWRIGRGSVICLSSRELLLASRLYNLQRDHVSQIGNGIDLAAWPVGRWPRKPIVVFAGRLESTKGPQRLIEAFARPELRPFGARLVIAGSGPMRPHLEELVAHSGVAEQIDFVGHLSQGALSELLRIASVFCLPSFRQESFSLSALQALASGTPVVATKAGNAIAVVEGIEPSLRDAAKGTAIVVSSGHDVSLARALHHMLADEDGGQRRGRIARRVAEANGDEAILDRIEGVYYQAKSTWQAR